jgi:hypothetical protein
VPIDQMVLNKRYPRTISKLMPPIQKRLLFRLCCCATNSESCLSKRSSFASISFCVIIVSDQVNRERHRHKPLIHPRATKARRMRARVVIIKYPGLEMQRRSVPVNRRDDGRRVLLGCKPHLLVYCSSDFGAQLAGRTNDERGASAIAISPASIAVAQLISV